MNWTKTTLFASAMVMIGCAANAAPTNVVQNGSFDQTNFSSSAGIGTLNPGHDVTGWATSGHSFLFSPS